jgi:hypothetical protein
LKQTVKILVWFLVALVVVLFTIQSVKCGFSTHYPSCLGMLGDFTGGVGTLVAVGVAIWAGLQWREQRRTEFEERWAFEMINHLIELENAFLHRRLPIFYKGDTPEDRQERINNALRKFNSTSRPLQKIWHSSFQQTVDSLGQKVWELERSNHQLDFINKNDLTYQQREEVEKLGKMTIAPFDQNEPDPFRDAFITDVNHLHEYLLGKIRHLKRDR